MTLTKIYRVRVVVEECDALWNNVTDSFEVQGNWVERPTAVSYPATTVELGVMSQSLDLEASQKFAGSMIEAGEPNLPEQVEAA